MRIHSIIVLLVLQCSTVLKGSLVRDDEIPEKIQYIFKGDMDSWEPPKEMSQKYPYYLSGYDYENRPVWVLELGRWDIKGAVEGDQEYKELFYKYRDKASLRIIRSIGELDPTDEDMPKEAIGILDLEGYTLEQLNSIAAVRFILETLSLFLDAAKFVNAVYIINANYFAETIVNIARPVLGKEFALVEVYGTDPAKWKPVLRRRIPADQLPEWYGGTKDFKPLRVYG